MHICLGWTVYKDCTTGLTFPHTKTPGPFPSNITVMFLFIDPCNDTRPKQSLGLHVHPIGSLQTLTFHNGKKKTSNKTSEILNIVKKGDIFPWGTHNFDKILVDVALQNPPEESTRKVDMRFKKTKSKTRNIPNKKPHINQYPLVKENDIKSS